MIVIYESVAAIALFGLVRIERKRTNSSCSFLKDLIFSSSLASVAFLLNQRCLIYQNEGLNKLKS